MLQTLAYQFLFIHLPHVVAPTSTKCRRVTKGVTKVTKGVQARRSQACHLDPAGCHNMILIESRIKRTQGSGGEPVNPWSALHWLVTGAIDRAGDHY
jgi:hypothetical protein